MMKFPAFPLVVVLIAASVCFSVAASGKTEEYGGSEKSSPAAPELSYLALFEGLHITGTPVDIDISSYRLSVGGKVDKPFMVSFQELTSLAATEKSVTLDCPGFFIDAGKWTGVPVKALLEKAGVKPGASEVEFSTPDNSYSSKLSLEKAMHPGTLLAWLFNGKPFHRVHGFPLRLIVPDEPGGVWVKWLGKIEVK